MPWLEKLWKKQGETQEQKTEGTEAVEEELAAESGKERALRYARYAMAAATLLFVVWYLRHPEYYADSEKNKMLLTNSRTYFVLFLASVLFTLIITPNRLSDQANRLLGWLWFAAAPVAVYAALFHLDSTRFAIVFGELDRIALCFTFVFLYLFLTIFVLLTGSIRVSAIVVAVSVAVLGIVNWFIVDFRGQAISAADLFSVKEAATVASGYKYDIDWYVFSYVFLTYAICAVSCKIRGFRALRFAPRVAVLGVWLMVFGGYYHICCRTTFLEDHNIRSQGFTHQLRYKQFDMLFTTLCTCFYLSAERPEGYSVDRVHEIGEAYVGGDDADGTKRAASGSGEDGTKRAASGSGEDGTKRAASGSSEDGTKRAASGSGEDGTKRAAAGGGEDGTKKTAAGAGEAAGAASGKEAQEPVAGSGFTPFAYNRVSAAEEDAGADPAGDGDSEEDDGADPAGDGDSEEKDSEEDAGASAEAVGSSEWNTPNVIVIMNESFADYTDIGKGLTLSQDSMPFIHGLTENTIKGTAYVSIFGGNTPNSEYEFLTGNTMGFLPPSSVGYNLFVRGEMPSLASELKSVGYDTLAIHPYRGTNYRRHIVYPQIGFDTYYTRDDFISPEYIRKYISDWQLCKRIVREYLSHKNKTDSPLFSYNVTIQNHGGYTLSNSKGVPTTIRILDREVDRTKTTMYENLIWESDRVFGKLVEYFEDEEDPVVILMFGDHQANLGDNTYKELLGKTDEELTPEELMEKYKVPFVLWANYDIEEETIEKTSLNYLYSILADRLGLPMTGYQKYLLDLSEEIPVLAAGGYWTADGEFYTLDDESSPYYDKINEYHILEYNYIFGDEDRYLDLFTLTGTQD